MILLQIRFSRYTNFFGFNFIRISLEFVFLGGRTSEFRRNATATFRSVKIVNNGSAQSYITGGGFWRQLPTA